MAHLLESMAYVGDTPWHSLGHELPPKQPIEIWAQKAGMDWKICETPVRFIAKETAPLGKILSYEDQKVLYRSDTKAALSVVSRRYKVVQPRAVLEFYRDLTQISGFELETAGVLKDGKKFWALARTGKESVLRGGDVVKGYILLATSCDGTLATIAKPTTVRVVCNNTLAMALNGTESVIRVPHSTTFEPQLVKSQLGIAVLHWDNFMYSMKTLSERKVKSQEAEKFLLKLMAAPAAATASLKDPKQPGAVARVQALYEGGGRGAQLASSKGTAWGLLNAVTQFVDHERRARNQGNRLDSAWFGAGAALKERALAQALALVD